MSRTFTTAVAAVSVVLAVVGLAHCAIAEDDYADQLPRIAPTAPDQTHSDFQIADGYRLDLIASEPLVNTPVAIEWAADGALFVCEMRGYSEDRDDELSRVSRLLDRDGDGVYETSTVFADRLLWPTAIFPYDGGLFVADAPDILYLRDEDGDGVADSQEVVLTGFSVGNVQGLLNSFRWGLDNRIHLACGTAGGKVRRPDQPANQAVSVRGHDLAFDPRTYEFELTSGGAQHGMCFDDWGRKFVSSNSDHLQQVMYEDRYIARNPRLAAPPARVSIAADGPQAEVFRISPVEPWRIVRTRLRVAGLARGPIEGGGRPAGYFTGATGVTIYRGDAWPEQDHGLAIIGDVGSNLVHRKRLTRHGVQMTGKRIDPESEFIASKDIWFRPAQFACGPDGGLTIVDVYREVIEHPKSLPPEIKPHLDLTSGRNRGRLYRVVPDGYRYRPTPRLEEASVERLVALLGHDNAWHRETAARLLFERQDPAAAPLLRKQLRDSDRPLARLHSMYALQGLDALTLDDGLPRLRDAHPQVVRHAIKLSEAFQPEPRLIESLAALRTHPHVEVRYQLAFTLGEFPAPQTSDWLAEILAQTPSDRWIQTAVASSAGKRPDRLLAAVVALQAPGFDSEFLAALATQVKRMDEPAARLRALRAIAEAEDRAALLPALGKLRPKSDPSSIAPELSERLADKQQRLVDRALERLTADQASPQQRIRAIELLSSVGSKRVAETLLTTLRQGGSAEVQLAALAALRSHRSAEVTDTLLELWSGWSPRLRSAAGQFLFASADRSLRVMQAIDEGEIAAEDISISRWNALASSRHATLKQRAKQYLEQSQSSSRGAVIEDYREALSLTGDARRGREVFKKQCAGCHRNGEVGHAIGPNLAAAATRGAESILTNVLDPNREVNPQYLNYVVLTAEGQTVAGMIAAENANSITLGQAESVQQTILRQDIELIRNTNQSIMPEGLEKAISKQAMADLIAYLLKSLR